MLCEYSITLYRQSSLVVILDDLSLIIIIDAAPESSELRTCRDETLKTSSDKWHSPPERIASIWVEQNLRFVQRKPRNCYSAALSMHRFYFLMFAVFLNMHEMRNAPSGPIFKGVQYHIVPALIKFMRATASELRVPPIT